MVLLDRIINLERLYNISFVNEFINKLSINILYNDVFLNNMFNELILLFPPICKCCNEITPLSSSIVLIVLQPSIVKSVSVIFPARDYEQL